jgi:hypothetical protein
MKTAELLAARNNRARLEHQRDRLIARAYQMAGCDPLDLALASGLTVEQVRKTTRRLRRTGHGRGVPQAPAARESIAHTIQV